MNFCGNFIIVVVDKKYLCNVLKNMCMLVVFY